MHIPDPSSLRTGNTDGLAGGGYGRIGWRFGPSPMGAKAPRRRPLAVEESGGKRPWLRWPDMPRRNPAPPADDRSDEPQPPDRGRMLLLLLPTLILLALSFAFLGRDGQAIRFMAEFCGRTPTLRAAMECITQYGNAPCYLLHIAVLVRAAKNRDRRTLRLAVTCLLVLGMTLVLVSCLKLAVSRPRPLLNQAKYIPSMFSRKYHSFPSNHAAESLVTCWALLRVFPGGGRLFSAALGLWYAVMCFSRVYLGNHYPSDILGSMAAAGMVIVIVPRVAAWLLPPRAPAS